jgi:hypothetical protein
VAVPAKLAAVRKATIICSVLPGVSQLSTALAFSAAFRSSSTLDLLLALAAPIDPPLCPSRHEAAQRPEYHQWTKNGMPYSTKTVMTANTTNAATSARVRVLVARSAAAMPRN